MERLRWLPVVVALAVAWFGWSLRPAPSPASGARAEVAAPAPPPPVPRPKPAALSGAGDGERLGPYARHWLERWARALGPAFEVAPRAPGDPRLLLLARPGALAEAPARPADADAASDAGCAAGAFHVSLRALRADVVVVLDTTGATVASLEPTLRWVRELPAALADGGVDAEVALLAELDVLRGFGAGARSDDGGVDVDRAVSSQDVLEVLLHAAEEDRRAPWPATLRPGTPLHLVLLSSRDASPFGLATAGRPGAARTPEARAHRFLTRLAAALSSQGSPPPAVVLHAVVGAALGGQVLQPNEPVVAEACAESAGATLQQLALQSGGLRASSCGGASDLEPLTAALVSAARRVPAPLDVDELPLARWPAVVASLEAEGDARAQPLALTPTGTCGALPAVWHWDGAHDHLCAGAGAQLLDAGFVALAGVRRCPTSEE